MFLGSFTHSLDSKGRVTIPAKYRDFVADGMVITIHPQGNCLMAMPMAEWQTRAQDVSALKMTDPNSALLKRMFFSSAEDLQADKQGRILLSQRLRELVGIENEVLIAGINTYFELWAPDRWAKGQEPLSDPAVTEKLFATLDI